MATRPTSAVATPAASLPTAHVPLAAGPAMGATVRAALAPFARALALQGGVILAALVVFGVFLLVVAGKNPLAVYADMWKGSFGTRFGTDRQFGIVIAANYSRRNIAPQNIQSGGNWEEVNGFFLPLEQIAVDRLPDQRVPERVLVGAVRHQHLMSHRLAESGHRVGGVER